MTEFKTKLDALKHKLESAKWSAGYHNKFVDYNNKIANKIEAEIKALEEALAPKQGDIYKNVNTSLEYILARVAYRKYCLINLLTGERYQDGTENMDEIFGCHAENFVKV